LTNSVTVGAGTLAVASGSLAPTAPIRVGITAGSPGVLSLAAGTLNANYNGGQFASSLIVAGATGAAGDVKINGGTFSVNQQLGLGAGSGGSAALELNGGTASIGSFLVVGFNNDDGLVNQTLGTLTINNNLMTIAAGGSGALGLVNLGGGTFNSLATTGYGPTIGGVFVGELGTATLNVSGAATMNLSGWGLRLAHNGGATGIVNLLGGTLSTTSVSQGGGYGQLNFNGGTLKARAANAAFMAGLSSAYVYAGGANINDAGFAITVGQPLLAPTGYGIGVIPVVAGGSGYISPPLAKISGGAGAGATATAQINPVTGVVTNILVTCPGSGYGPGDTLAVTFLGGGGGGASAATPVLIANQGGGLTKLGVGALTLTNGSTYPGTTLISAGKLALTGAGSIAASTNITVNSGATFDVSGVTGFALASGQMLQGLGTINGSLTVNGAIAPGIGGIGTLTLNNSGTLNGTALMEINRNAGSPLNDQVRLTSGILRLGGVLTVTNLGAALQAGDTFQLFNAGSYTGTFSLTNLPPLAGNLFWTNTIASNGRIAVANTVSLTPPNIAWQMTGANLSLSWPTDHIGWRLLVQTNNIASGLSSNTNDWAAVPAAAATNALTVPLDPALPAEFYRLVYP
jgi:autotransporter-associated beta strand protein